MKSIVDFSVSVVGDTTGETFSGTFEAKVNLSNREILKKDEIRRALLGDFPNGVSAEAAAIAAEAATLAIHITKSPLWWQQSGHGVDLTDSNVSPEILDKLSNAILKERTSLTKKATEAKQELKEIVDANNK